MPRVLIIDDDADQRDLLAVYASDLGWEVVQAQGGDEGVELAKVVRPDVVLCDLLMQGGNGFQVCSALRSDPDLCHTHIVVLSGRAFDADRQAAIQAGADEYLRKPVSLRAITQVLSRVGAEKPGAPAPMTGSESTVMEPFVRFWGVRGSIATPGPSTVRYGGNTSCVELRADGQIIILDAGTGLRGLGRKLIAEFGDRPLDLTLLLSHTHWDHIQGLPFFGPLYRPESHLRIVGYEGARSSLTSVLTSQMESPYFPIGLKDVPSNFVIEEQKDLKFSVGPVSVEAWFANHPGMCVGYRLNTSRGSMAFFPDNEPPSRQQLARDGSGPPGSTTVIYAADQEARLVRFLKGVDILVMDAQYTAEEYVRYVGWGHGCVDDVVRLAMMANVKQLFLFHHDPDHDDDAVDRMQDHARFLVEQMGSPLQVQAAREGAVVPLG
jgi:phosphoribosyl 1,2-cyclic phosphodiesterase/CheY-like chemotaxis protein